jgi:DNA invertase Pin-like site-specific DNA recombinase
MRILAYLYSDPLLEPTPDPSLWGWDLDRIYQDLAVAGKPDRPQLQALLADCVVETSLDPLLDPPSEPLDYLLVRRLAELGDSVQAVGERLAQLAARQIQVVAVESGDPRRLDLLKLLQEVQRSQRSRRIRQGHARNRVKALAPPGKAPYGYKRSRNRYVVDRTTAPVVTEFFNQFLLFGSLRGAVRHIAKK